MKKFNLAYGYYGLILLLSFPAVVMLARFVQALEDRGRPDTIIYRGSGK